MVTIPNWDTKRSAQGSLMGSGSNLRKHVCALALLLSATVGSIRLGIAPAEADYQQGVDAYQTGDFRAAYEAWQPLAQEGDATAQNALGALYDHGLGVPEDHVKAAYWYEKAAKQNFPLAMRNLGTLYANGHGVPLDPEQAKFWLQKAADAGDEQAAKRLEALTRSVPPAPPSAQSGAAAFPTETPKQEAVRPKPTMRGGHDLTSMDIVENQPRSGIEPEAAPSPSISSGPPPSGVTAGSGAADELTEVPPAIAGTEPSGTVTETAQTASTETPAAEASPTAPTESAPAAEVPAPAPAPVATNESGLPKSTTAQPESSKGKKTVAEPPAASAAPTTDTPEPSTPAQTSASPTSDSMSPASPTTTAMTTKTEPLQLAPADPTPAAQPATSAAGAPSTQPAPSTEFAAAEAQKAAPAEMPVAPAEPAPTPAPAPTETRPGTPAPVVTTPPEPATVPAAVPVQAAAVVKPAPAPIPNWLLGEWQGPTQGCPPNGGVEFTGTESKVYYKGKINATLPVSYRVEPGTVIVSTIGNDGITQDYVYQKTGANSMIIVGIPQGMPKALLGAAHRRCGVAPKAEAVNVAAPVAVYADTPTVSDNQMSPKESAKTYAESAPIAGAPSAAPAVPELPPTTKPVAQAAPEPAPMPEAEPAHKASAEPIIPELKPEESAAATQTAEAPKVEEPAAPVPDAIPSPETPGPEAGTQDAAASEEKTEPTAPTLPKSTPSASAADKAKKAEEAKAAEAASAEKTEPETPPPAPEAANSAEPVESAASTEPAPIAGPAPSPESTTTESAADATPAPEPVTPESTTTESTTTEPATPQPEPTQEAAVTPPAPAPEPSKTQEQLAEEALAAGDMEKALSIWEPLAKGGNTGVAVNVAGMYEFGSKPMPQDYAKAAEWYMLAAEHGDPYAQYKMGRAYTRGSGVPIDRVQAYKWLTIAMQSLSNAKEEKTGKASRMEIETGLNDIVGAMSQEEVTKAAQLVRQYNEQHKIAE